VEPGARPAAPVNVSARWLTGSQVQLSWSPGLSSPLQSPLQFTVEYRTVGQWVLLADYIRNTSYTWKTPSRGVTYHFQVLSSQVPEEAGSSSVHSDPSSAVILLPDGPSQTVVLSLSFIALMRGFSEISSTSLTATNVHR